MHTLRNAKGYEAMDYPVVIRPLGEEEGGGFIAFFPDLPGCVSDGETPEEALEHVREAYAEWMDTARTRPGFVLPAPGKRARDGWDPLDPDAWKRASAARLVPHQ